MAKILFENAHGHLSTHTYPLLNYICEQGDCCPDKLEQDISHPSLSIPKFNAYTLSSTILKIIMNISSIYSMFPIYYWKEIF